MSPENLQVGAVVLAGGQSRRMGRDKNHLAWDGESMLQRVVGLVGGVLGPVVVALRRDQPVPTLPDGVEFACDAVADHGPLAGMAAGFAAVEDRCEVVFVTGCDHPLLRPAFILRLIDLLGEHQAVVPSHNNRLFPLTAVYRISTLPLIDKLLGEGDLRVRSMLAACAAHTVFASSFADVDPKMVSLSNINDPNDYDRLRADRDA